MRRLLPALAILSFSVILAQDVCAQSRKPRLRASPNFTIEAIAPNVWVAIHNENFGKAICNAGIIDLGDKTVIFDPFMTPSAAMELREVARKLTRRNYAYVVNSHYHTDHIRGNQAFLPNATIVTSTTTRDQIERNEPGEQEWEKKHAPTLLAAVRKSMVNANETERSELPYWVGYYEGIIESSDQLFTALADQLFDDSLWIEGSKMSTKIVECKNGHTISDAVILIPKLGIAFMGDLLCTDRHPWISDGDVDGWRSYLKLFYEDTLYHTYLPGHGKVSGKPSLQILYNYLGDVKQLSEAAQTDSAQSVLMNKPIPEDYRSWLCGRFYHPNLQFLVSTARAKRQAKIKSEKKVDQP